jgi:iron complex transport system substrate-binding protein
MANRYFLNRFLAGALPVVAIGSMAVVEPAIAAATSRPATSRPAATTTTISTSTTTPKPAAVPKLPVLVPSIGDGLVEVTDVSRIVALNGDVTEILYALGLGSNIVANDITGYYPAEAAKKPKIGYQRQLSAEGILSFKPTLVIGNEDAGPPSALAQLRAAGATVVIVPAGENVFDAPKKIRWVGTAVGLEAAGDALGDKTYASIQRVQKKWSSTTQRWEPRAVFLYLRGSKTMLLGGSGTRASAMLEAAGVTDGAAFDANVKGYVPITSEALVAAKPDVIVVLTEGLKSVGGIEGVLAIPGIALTPAGKTKRVIDFDDLEFLELGPRTPEALDKLVAELYKK